MRGTVCVAAVAVLISAGPAFGQLKKPEVVAKIDGHRGGVAAVAFNAKGDRIATGSGNGAVRVWDVDTGKLLTQLDDQKNNTARVGHLAFGDKFLSTSSHNSVIVWDLSNLERPIARYEDPFTADPTKLGTVTGDGKLCYFTGTENSVPKLQSYSLRSRSVSTVDLPPKLKPLSLAPIADPTSGLVAFYCATGEKNELGAIALVGLGDPRGLLKDVPPPLLDRPISISFSPDAKWLVVGNGSKVAYWRVPGSQVIRSDPKTLPGEWFISAAGPGNRLAVASLPEAGKSTKVTIYDISGAEPKVLTEYNSGIEIVSVLAFSPDGSMLAVGDEVEGVLQLWAFK